MLGVTKLIDLENTKLNEGSYKKYHRGHNLDYIKYIEYTNLSGHKVDWWLSKA